MDRQDMRVSDAERQEVVDQLGTALGEGRLDVEEYDERVQSAYQAKTYRDLVPLTADLPGLPVPAPLGEKRAALARARGGEPPSRAIAVLSVVFVFIGLSVLMSVATGGVLIPFWPLFIFGFWGLARSGRYGRR
ncbi:DUF1707 SHOCT-like domain-containing protein [Actinocatenispora rupis]|uniref:DUF1707 domain-containing protein n=1 Tax=Actinocatenispora rupis TaxID=519421 RepID=A0A8J3J3U1_9ACTN|nr:DUF1707 domain-containing protein [Actinocatenispora rupis]GID11605.1 hypothetical protein Aru02nite_24940 [Actinocatenispora rupis]